MVAAARGTKQVAFAVIATTAVLVAVFLPIGFLEGNTGRLFRELAVALAGAVAISAFVALTLTPMMSSKLVRAHSGAPRGVSGYIDRGFKRIANAYRAQVARSSGHPAVFGVLMLAALGLSFIIYRSVPSELAPPEDRGSFFVMLQGPEGAVTTTPSSRCRRSKRSCCARSARASRCSASTAACRAASARARKCTPAW
jgi:multidrug efflux pump